jgi:hypothetical protein
LSFGESFLKLIDARLFPGSFESGFEAIPFPFGSILGSKCLRDVKNFISIGFARRAEALDCNENLGDMILSTSPKNSMLGRRLKTVAQVLQIPTYYVKSCNIDIASRSGCPDFKSAFDKPGCE